MENRESSDSDSNINSRRLTKRSFSSDESSSEDGRIINQRRKTRRISTSSSSTSETTSSYASSMSSTRHVIPETESDSADESEPSPPLRRRRRRAVVLHTDNSSTSSDDDIVRPIRRISRARAVVGSEREDTSLSGCEYNSQAALKAEFERPSTDSDTGDENAEKCPICYRTFKNQELASPEACDHLFCLHCLLLWSKNKAQCPLDRLPFTLIFVKDKSGEVSRLVPVEIPPIAPLDFVDAISCCICGGYDREDVLMLCDGCDRGYHLDCLDPPLAAIPENEWFCTHCSNNGVMANRSQASNGDGDAAFGRWLQHDRRMQSRLRYTSRQSARIWARLHDEIEVSIQFHVDSSRRQEQSSPLQAIRRPSSSRTHTSQGAAPTSTSTRRATRRKRTRRTSRRHYTIQQTSLDGNITERVVETRLLRKKKRKRRKPRTRRRATTQPLSVRRRLARSMGLMAPTSSGQLLPGVSPAMKRSMTPSNMNASRASAGIPTLHIFEPRHELAPVSSESEGEFEMGSEGVSLLTRRPVSMTSRHRDRCKAVDLLQGPTRRRIIPATAIANPGPVDLLDSILESQTIWHSKNTDVTIRSDGTVETPDRVDVRTAEAEKVRSQAPIFPASGSKSSDIRPYGSNAGSSSSTPTNYSSPFGGSGVQRFGAPRNDREGYANFFNSSSSGSSFCRGGPPLRFRLPPRPQLRRIPLLPRRPIWPQPENREEEGEEDKAPTINEDDVDPITDEPLPEEDDKAGDEDIDLYSDIESNNGNDEGNDDSEFPALGPPPEPPASLFGVDIETDIDDNKPASDAYDPAEPCDSEDEMVIDESHEPKEEEPAPQITAARTPSPPPAIPIEDDAEERSSTRDGFSEATVEYSHKEVEERDRDLEQLQREGSGNDQSQVTPPALPLVVEDSIPPIQEKVGVRLSFSIENSPTLEESQESSALSPGNITPDHDRDQTLELETQIETMTVNSAKSPPKVPTTPTSSVCSSPSASPCYPGDEGTSPPRQDRSSGNYSVKSPVSSPLHSHEISEENDNNIIRINTGLEGLDVEEVSSELDDSDFDDKCSESSLSLSDLSATERRSSSIAGKKKKRKKKREKAKIPEKCASEEGEIENGKDNEKTLDDHRDDDNYDENISIRDKKGRMSKSKSPAMKVLTSRENRKGARNEKDVSWKKPSKKDKNYREGRKLSKERARSKEKRKSRSVSPKRDKKRGKDKKKGEKKERKKEIERYDVRKVVKDKEVRRTDSFGRDLPSRSLSLSRSRSRSRARGRNNARKASRSPSRSPVRRRPRSPRRRFRTRSRSSPSPHRNKKKPKSTVARKGGSQSRTRRSHSRRRSASRSPRPGRAVKKQRPKKSWSRSRSLSLSPLPQPKASKLIRLRRSVSPLRVRRSISPVHERHSFSRSWSHLQSPVLRDPSLEKLTVVLTAKDKKKRKKRKDNKRLRKADPKKKKSGNSKEVFASGDNVLVSVNFNRTSKNGSTGRIPSPSPTSEVIKQKKKRAADDLERPAKKSKSSGTVSKTVVDAALATQAALPKRKKLTRLNDKDAEIILSRKPLAVIDLDISPYREQTPSPINVVVVSDSGSGEEGKAPTPPRVHAPDVITLNSPPLSVPPPAYLMASSGPKTPPEPPVKFSISKPLQLRPIANPLADGDEGLDEEEEANESIEQLNNDSESCKDIPHKGPNTPPEPRGPSTPKSPSSPQSSPDAYDPFEPTKSRSPSPVPEDRPTVDENDVVINDNISHSPANIAPDDNFKIVVETEVAREDVSVEPVEVNLEIPQAIEAVPPPVEQENVGPISTTKTLPSGVKKAVPQLPPAIAPLALPVFSLASPNKTPNRQPMGIQRLQHRLGSPVNKTPNSVKSTPEKRGPELLSTGNFKVRNTGKRNGDGKPRPLQDATNETVDMDDSPYSPATSEGDDLFDPPIEAPKQSKPQTVAPYKPTKATPVKSGNKFDMLFGSGTNLSPMKNGGKKLMKSAKNLGSKGGVGKTKKGSKKGIALKMDEDQLRILDDLPSSAVELQVKDKFLKKLNRQERVVDEVKTVLKPHYARKHINKDEYKEILRKAVPKICHSKSGEINPSKIQQLVEAYVRKYRHAKKKGGVGVGPKQKTKKAAMFS